MLFRSQYTSESNFYSISSCGEILDANVGSLERWDFSRVLVNFLKYYEAKLDVYVSMYILGFNEVQRRCLDFRRELMIFSKFHEYKLVV